MYEIVFLYKHKWKTVAFLEDGYVFSPNLHLGMVQNGKRHEKKWTRGTSSHIPPSFSLHRPHYLSLHGRNQGMRKLCNAPSRSRSRASSFLGAERCQFDPFIAPKFLTRLSTMQATTVWMPKTKKKKERTTPIPNAPNVYDKIYHHKIAVLKLLLKLD